MVDCYLLYSSNCWITGKQLGQWLFGEDRDKYGKIDNMESRRYDYLIRYGCSRSVDYIPSVKTINRKKSIENTTNKYKMLKKMDNAGVPVSEYSRDLDELVNKCGYPIIGRSFNHMQGSDVNLILQRVDDEIQNNDYYLEYINKKKEIRVHVINNQIKKINVKKLENVSEYNSVVWNYENGFVFGVEDNVHNGVSQSIVAVNCLGLDFGAVDLVIDENNNVYIFEVNTGAGLSENNLEIYGKEFASMIGMDEDDVAGMEYVDWSLGEDE